MLVNGPAELVVSASESPRRIAFVLSTLSVEVALHFVHGHRVARGSPPLNAAAPKHCRSSVTLSLRSPGMLDGPPASQALGEQAFS